MCLQKLSGVFEVRIYPMEMNVKSLVTFATIGLDGDNTFQSAAIDGLDLSKLNRALSTMDNSKIRRRRAVYSRLYHEAMVSQEPGKGISFTNMLLMLAHHKLIDDREALV